MLGGGGSTGLLFAISVTNTNLDLHVSTKVNTFRFAKWGLGASPQKPKIFKKKSNKMKASPLR